MKSHFSRWISFMTLITLCQIGVIPARGEINYDFYTGVRQLGMGGAYTAVVNDETAVLSNPAGLGKLRDYTFTLFDPEIHVGSGNQEVASVAEQVQGTSIQGLLDLLNADKNKHWHLKTQFFPSIVAPNFGIGIHAKYIYDAEVVGNNYRLDYLNDYAAALGYCLRFFGGVVKLGFSGRLVNRTEIHEDLSAASTNLEIKNLASEGLGVGADIGLILTAPVATLPALAIVLRDVGETRYDLGPGIFHGTSTRPSPTKSRIDAGVAFFPVIGNHTRTTLTVDVRGLQTLSEESNTMKRVHVGSEINFSDFFFLRAGLNQSYWTAGLEISTAKFQMQFASYGEDIGSATVKREDRRYIGKFSLRY